MNYHQEDSQHLIYKLTERQKELNCIYGLEDILTDFDSKLSDIFGKILKLIPEGWQYTQNCFVEIEYKGLIHKLIPRDKGSYVQKAPLYKNNVTFGEIRVYYREISETQVTDPFLKEEYSLLNTLSGIIASYLVARSYKDEPEALNGTTVKKQDWKIIIDMLQRTEMRLYFKIARKILNLLFQKGVEEVKEIYSSFGIQTNISGMDQGGEINSPLRKRDNTEILKRSKQVFSIAEIHLSNEEIMENIHHWMQEDKLSFLISTLERKETSLTDIQEAIYRYHELNFDMDNISQYSHMNIKVLLIQRLFTSHLDFINVAKKYIHLEDFYDVLQHTVYPSNSHGKLGGKSTGLFFADNILKNETDPEFSEHIKTPQTWYITSDAMHNFLHYNNLEEVVEQKYKDIEVVRTEYGNIIQMFKNSNFPQEISKGLAQVLEDVGETPIIVRSSSLLEDSFGAAFSGKYKSLFLANQGSKADRLTDLKDAIAEVYASILGPDPIEYRKEKKLLDFQEEMAILIQEVVGIRCGKYFFPAFAGVAFSNNEFRWSSRIKRDDGLIRLVPGLGTRAVDRLSDDYPVLASPGKPGIRVNASPEEVLKYSPRSMDLINLETNSFETMPIKKVISECKDNFPLFKKLFSVYADNYLQEKSAFNIDFDKEELLVTFNGLFKNTDFLQKIKKIMDILQEKMNTPVDIEFAVKDDDIYLLQCRPQNFSGSDEPQPIPQDIPENDIVFTAHKHISNGWVPEITHLVYVDPDKYSSIRTIEELRRVGRCVGKLNKILPKKKFILMGPGRWGSKGDIKLGVNVTYSDINKTAVLIEIAREKGNYVPDLSFGTHFFQDLVEAQIRYIPLYPDKKENIFNTRFFQTATNILADILPEYSDLEDCVKAIDIPSDTNGKILKIFMNADLEEAIAYLGNPGKQEGKLVSQPEYFETKDENFWYWRQKACEFLAANLDAEVFGVKDIYIFGSVKNANAGPASDIDLLIHFIGKPEQKAKLLNWLEGWSMCLDHFNYLKTGYRTGGLLDVHLITDEDIESNNSYALKIGAVTDAARKLEIKR